MWPSLEKIKQRDYFTETSQGRVSLQTSMTFKALFLKGLSASKLISYLL